jgi:hypothetical protein
MPSLWVQRLHQILSAEDAVTDGTSSAGTFLCLQRARIAVRQLEHAPECAAVAGDSFSRARKLLEAAELSALRLTDSAGDARTTYYSELAERLAQQAADIVLRVRSGSIVPRE